MTEPAITPELVQKHNLTPDEYAEDQRNPRPRAELHRAGHLLGDVERALQLQEHAAAAEDFPDQVAEDSRRRGRGKRRHHRHRRRPGHRVQDRVAQSSERGRAVPGRGHGRRRHRARHFHDGRAAGVRGELAAVWADHCERQSQSEKVGKSGKWERPADAAGSPAHSPTCPPADAKREVHSKS